MLLPKLKVKYWMIFTILLVGCTHHEVRTKPVTTSSWKPAVFIPHENWLAENVDYDPSNQIRQQIEQSLPKKLLTRNEAHITVITPPEWDILKTKLKMADLNSLAVKSGIEKMPFKPLCVGEGRSGEKLTYYVVVDSPDLLKLREKIAKAFESKGGNAKSFFATHFFPHITIGFTDSDLHESDGVIKNTASCQFDITTE